MSHSKKSFLTSAAILTVGSLITRLLGLFFKMPLAATVGDYGLGLYSVAYPIYNVFIAISIAGIPTAISKMVAERVGVGNYKGAYRAFYVALVVIIVLGAFFSAVMFFGASVFVDIFGWGEDALPSVIALSFAPFFVGLISAMRGFFQGMQRMGFSSTSQIVEQIGRVTVGLALAVVLTAQYGVAYGAAGATFGATVGAVIAFLFLYIAFLIFRYKQKDLIVDHSDERESTKYLLRTLLLFALPIAFGGIVSTVMGLINSATVISCLQQAGFVKNIAIELFGQLDGKAQTLVSVPLVVGTSLSASLVPSISESFIRQEKDVIKQKTSLAIRIGLLVSLPSAVGLSILSKPIISLLFYADNSGYELLTGLAFVVVFNVAMTTLQGILQGAGHFYKPLKNLLIGIIVKLILNYILIPIPSINIYGAVISTVAASFIIAFLNFVNVKKYLGINPITTGVLKTILATAVMGVSTKFFYMFINNLIDFRFAVIVSVVFAIVVYFIMIYLTKAITKEEIKAVRGK